MTDWPPRSLECERMFGGPHARLYPLIGKDVWTPMGRAKLLQVFQDRVVVGMPGEKKVSYYKPSQIRVL